METHNNYPILHSIQWARAMAALLVVHTHAGLAVGGATNLPRVIRPSNMGAIGVDIFFIISGFVISYSLGKKSYRMGDFFSNRFTRIIPAYYVLTGLGLLLGLPATWRSVWNAFFFLPIFDANRFTMPVLGVGWSLCFEIYFYLLAGVCFLAKRRTRYTVLLCFILGLIGLYVSGHAGVVRFFLSPLMLEFVGGIGVYVLWRKSWLNDFRIGGALLLGALTMAIFIGLPASKFGFVNVVNCIGQPRLGFLRSICWGLPSFLLITAMICFEPWIRKMPKFLSSLGGVSYSLYLVHLFVIFFVGTLYERHAIGILTAFSFVIVLSIALAYLSRDVLEVRLGTVCRKIFGRIFTNSRPKPSPR